MTNFYSSFHYLKQIIASRKCTGVIIYMKLGQ